MVNCGEFSMPTDEPPMWPDHDHLSRETGCIIPISNQDCIWLQVVGHLTSLTSRILVLYAIRTSM